MKVQKQHNRFRLAVQAAMLCFLLAFSGCSGNGISNTQTGTEEIKTGESSLISSSSQSIADEENPGPDVLVMEWPDTPTSRDDLEEVQTRLSEITREKLGVSVQFKKVDYDITNSEIPYDIAAGEQIDLCVTNGYTLGNLVQSQDLLPLDALLEEYGQELKDICGVQLTGGYYGDSLYAVPTVYTNGRRAGFLCRKDILDKYDISIDEDTYYSLDELEDIFQTVKAGEGEDFYIFTKNISSMWNGIFDIAYDSLGYNGSSGVLLLRDSSDTGSAEEAEEYEIVDLYETKGYQTYAEYCWKWAQKGYLRPDCYLEEQDDDEEINRGDCFGFITKDVTEQSGEYSARCNYDMTFIPLAEAWMTTDSYQASMWSIPVTSANPEKAMEFLELLYTDAEVINLLQYGIEGRDYVIVEQDQQGTVIDFPEGEDRTTIPYYIHLGIYGDRLKAYIRYPQSTDRNQKIREFSESITRKSPALGFVFQLTDIQAQMTAIDTVVEKYNGLISAGAVDPEEELPDFIRELKEAGIDDVIAEKQRQYDAWRAEQEK